MKMEKLSKYSSLFLRLAISIVFFWFGFSQLFSPENWTRMIPDYVLSFIPLSPTTMIYLNGSVEIILALLLLMGLFTRVVSALLFLHLIHITTILGYGPAGARDLALAIATLSIFLHGADEFCLDNHIYSEKLRKSLVPANRH